MDNLEAGEQNIALKNPRNVDKNLLDIFWKLAEVKESIRINSALSALRILSRKQEIMDGDTKSPELEYTVERLVKGMASSRKVARLGFSLLLTEVLRMFTVVTIEEVIALIEKHLPVTNKQEKCHMVIGQLLVYSAIVKSNRLKNDPYLSFIILNLFNLSNGRSYIQQAAYNLIAKLFLEMEDEQFKASVWPHLKKELSCGWEKCNADVLCYMMLCLRSFPTVISSKFLKGKWDFDDLFCQENIPHIKKMIKQSTNVHPQVHPVCLEVVQLSLSRKDFKEIWTAVVDENLFETDQNEKAYLGFHIVQESLSKTQKKKIVKHILSPKFCSAFTRSFLNKKHPLNSAANELAEFFIQYIKDSTDPHIQVAVLKVFLQPAGTTRVGQILCRKEVIAMISSLLPEAVKLLFEIMKSFALAEKNGVESDGSDNHKQVLAVHQIGTLISHPAIVSDVEWRIEVLKFLLLHSFFTVTNPSADVPWCDMKTESLSDPVHEAFRHSFTRALDSLNRRIDDSGSLSNQLLCHIQTIVDFADMLLQSKEVVTPVALSEKFEASWELMKNMVHKLNKQCKKDRKMKESNAFQLLFLHLGLQLLFDADHVSSILEELQICCKKALKLRRHADENESHLGDGPPWIQVVVDIILSLLSQPARHMYCIVSPVFSLLCPFMTTEALQQILNVINPDKSSDEEPILEDSGDEGDENLEFESGSSDEEMEPNNEDENVDEEFKLKVQNALGPAAEADDNESEADLTDSEMFKLDEAISAAFRSRKATGKNKFDSEQKTLMNFRMRCLDLLMIYLKTEPPMRVVMQCILPLLAANEFSNQNKHQHPLSVKVMSTLKYASKLRKFEHCKEVEQQEIQDLLEKLITKAHSETNPATSNTLYSLSLFLVLCERKLLNVNKDTTESLQPEESLCFKSYLSALEKFVRQSNCHILPQMFVILMNACPELAWNFFSPLKKYAFDESVRLHKKTQCLSLILSVIKFSKAQKTVSPNTWLKASKNLIPKLIQALKFVLSNTDDIKPVYTTEIFDVLVTLENTVKEKTEKSVLREYSDILPLLMGMSSTQCKRLQGKGKKLLRKLILMLGGKLPSKHEIPEKKAIEKQRHSAENTNTENSSNANNDDASSSSSEEEEK